MQGSEPAAAGVSITNLEAGIVNALLYFDLFRYPLAATEIARLFPFPGASLPAIEQGLERLLQMGILATYGGFFQLSDMEPLDQRRSKGNSLADLRLKRAEARSRLVAKFPFVRAVMVSGSLSKHYMEPESDIDFFVVAESGRLWIARTMLILYKKVFLFNSHKEFCMNYFVDTEHLEIEDKNIFTATEVAFLLPTANYGLYESFRQSNTWADQYFPNYGLREETYCSPLPDSASKRLLEWLLAGSIGRYLDDWCLRRTLGRWRKKFAHFDQEKFEVALRSRKYVSKHHPSHFQERVIGRLEQRRKGVEQRFGICLETGTKQA